MIMTIPAMTITSMATPAAAATTIMGTFSAYSGRTVRLSDLLTNTESEFYNMNAGFTAADFERTDDIPMPVEGVAPVPGKA